MSKSGRRKRKHSVQQGRAPEALGVLLLLVGVFWLLSLLSYSPYVVEGEPYTNWMGILGARVAGATVLYLGRIPPFLTVLVVLLWGWRLLRHSVDRALLRRSLKILGVQWLLSVLLAFPYFVMRVSSSYDMAGVLGGAMAEGLVTYTGVVGGPLVWLAVTLLFFMLAFDLKPGRAAAAVAGGLAAVAGAAGSLLRRFGALVRWLGQRARRVHRGLAERREHRRQGGAPFVGGATEASEQETIPEPVTGRSPGAETPQPEAVAPTAPPDAVPAMEPEPLLSPPPAPPRDARGYVNPPLELFARPSTDEMGTPTQIMQQQARLLEEKLTSFGVRAEVTGWQTGPVITRFEVKPAAGVKVNQIVNLADDLALAMQAKRIRIVAPIPGKAAVGVEIPNPQTRVVRLREIVESETYQHAVFKIPLALGQTISGEPYVVDLATMPHLLIAGTTGSGKSVCINTLIASLLYRLGPQQCRFILIDPKMLELGIYNTIPHLITPVVTDPRKAVDALRWAVLEMEDRFNRLAAAMVRDLEQYNNKIARQREAAPAGAEQHPSPDDQELPEPLPYLIVIVDELADLMMTASVEIETLIQRIAQKARAVGIHLILATQRPSVDVITGPIKANFSTRIAFQVPSKIDSRTILDANGAEKLLGRGDMLFSSPAFPEPMRIHGAFLSNEEIERLVNFVSSQELETEERDIFSLPGIENGAMGAAGESLDDMLREAAQVVVTYKQGSTSLLQRRLGVGYTRAARMMDQLEMLGVVGPPDGTKAREVVLSEEDLDDLPWGGRR
jgi:DNA segregation ATPase FtsK/SpoIIIE, S-DNA-T family